MKKNKPLSCLIDTCQLVSSYLNLDDVLSGVTKMSKDVLMAEAGSLMLLNEETNMLDFVVALGSKGSKFKKGFSLKVGQGIAGWVAKTGKALVVPDVRKDRRFFKGSDKTTGFVTRSIIAVPLTIRNRIIGVLEVINAKDKASFSNDDIPMFQAFACQVAVAVENARMHQKMLEQQKLEQELVIAGELQGCILPKKQFRSGGLSVSVGYKPAKVVSGDFFDIIKINKDRVIVVIGDVAGKGIPAALYMVRVMTRLRSFLRDSGCLKDAASKLNNILISNSIRGIFATITIVCLDIKKKKAIFVNAGHMDPVILDGNKEKKYKIQKGVPIGIFQGSEYPQTEVPFDKGSSIFLYTDGITEARNKGKKEFGENRLKKLVKEYIGKDSIKRIFKDVDSFSKGTDQHDDLTAVLIHLE